MIERGFRRRLQVSILALFVSTIMTVPVAAQTNSGPGVRMTIQDVLSFAEKNNFAAQLARQDIAAARAGLRQSRAAWLPHLSLTKTFNTTNDPIAVFGYKLKQGIVTAADFSPEALNDPDRLDHFGTRVELRQSVFNPSGIYEAKAAASQTAATEASAQRISAANLYEVKSAYYRLVLARRRVAVIDSARVLADSSLAVTRRYLTQGLVTRAALLDAEVHVSRLESQYLAASFAVSTASDRLRYLIGRTDTTEIIPTSRLDDGIDSPENINTTDLPGSRSDLIALQRAEDAAQAVVRARTMQLLPRIDVMGGYEINDRTLFGVDRTNWGVGAVLTWNLFSGYSRIGGVEKARANLRKARITREEHALLVQTEFNQTRRSVFDAWSRLSPARRAVDQARESLRIRTDRYAQGLETTTDLLNAEVRFSEQGLAFLERLYAYYGSIFRLELVLEKQLLSLN